MRSGVRHARLKMLEGMIATVPPQGGWEHPMQPGVSFDSANAFDPMNPAGRSGPRIYQTRRAWASFVRATEVTRHGTTTWTWLHAPNEKDTIGFWWDREMAIGLCFSGPTRLRRIFHNKIFIFSFIVSKFKRRKCQKCK